MTVRKRSKRELGLRYRGIRRDTTIGHAEHEAARILNLPGGCVQFVLPGGKKARTDKRIRESKHFLRTGIGNRSLRCRLDPVKCSCDDSRGDQADSSRWLVPGSSTW